MTVAGGAVAIVATAAGLAAGWRSSAAQGDTAGAADAGEVAVLPAAPLTAEEREQGGGEADAVLPAPAITFEEHQQAVLRTAACLEAAGHTRVSLVPGKGLRTTKIRSSISVPDGADPGDTVRAAHAASMGCHRQHLDAADEAWQAQLDRDPVKLAQAMEHLAACVAAGGPAETVKTGGGYFYAYYTDLPLRTMAVVHSSEDETYGQCALEFEAETGFLAPPPGVSN